MESLGPPMSHHLSAAAGWIELGAIGEAERELAKLPQEWREHPEALLVRWELAAQKKDWEEAQRCGRIVAKQMPERSDGWIKQAYALHELKRTKEAYEVLHEVVGRFSLISVVPYNLACYSAQLGNANEALLWIQEAVKIGGVKEIIGMALKDEDLRPLWSELEKLKCD
jgi:predicted Zn-dependent protease